MQNHMQVGSNITLPFSLAWDKRTKAKKKGTHDYFVQSFRHRQLLDSPKAVLPYEIYKSSYIRASVWRGI